VALAHAKPPRVVRHDARGVLAAMLQYRERVVERLINGVLPDDADKSAHGSIPKVETTAKRLRPSRSHRYPSLDVASAELRILLHARRDLLRVRPEPCRLPPPILVQFEEIQDEHQEADDQHAAREAECGTEHPVDPAQSRVPDQLASGPRHERSQQQREYE